MLTVLATRYGTSQGPLHLVDWFSQWGMFQIQISNDEISHGTTTTRLPNIFQKMHRFMETSDRIIVTSRNIGENYEISNWMPPARFEMPYKESIEGREYWMVNRGPGFLVVVWLGLGTEFRSEKIPRKRLGTVSVIPRKKVLIPRYSEFRGRANSEVRSGTEWSEKMKFYGTD